MASDWIRRRYSPSGMQVGTLNVYFAGFCVSFDFLCFKCLERKEGGRGEGSVPLKSQVPPGNFGPMSRILNHTAPEPSKAAAVVGAFAIYMLTGPSWYTA